MIIGKLFVGILVLVLSNAMHLKNDEPTAKPKLPDLTHMMQQYEEMSYSFKIELSDASAEYIQRKAEYESNEMKITSAINAANSLINLYKEKVSYCDAEFTKLEKSSNQYSQSILAADENTKTRNTQLDSFTNESKIQSERDVNILSILANIQQRIQKEIDSQAHLRGNGVSFDKFVANHQQAVEKLHQSQEIVTSLQKAVQEKMNHTATSLSLMTTVLNCSDCQNGYKSVVALTSSFPIAQQQRSQICDVIRNGNEVSVLTEKIQFQKEQLIQLHNDDAVQQKAALQRSESIKTQMAKLDSLRSTAQF
eukprot:c7917_g1_i1.p1 GENE.c7917_g1_i1~~c7917_g1_i1.p1  ORF type:complete len:309 (+),score=133.01 c7917_g1_i1:46-972(+)